MSVTARMSGHRRGLIAEMVAAGYMMMRGYRPVKWRYRCRMGEIDLIFRRGGYYVFAEVKFRQGEDAALGSVDAKTQRRVAAAAVRYVAGLKSVQKGGEWPPIRFDVIAVTPYFMICHIENAFGVQS